MSAPLPDVQFIRGGIGAGGGANLADDVVWVQGLLNRWLKSKAKLPIGLDGSFGESTRQVVVQFQQEVVKLKDAKGGMAPGDATTRSLLSLRPANLKVTTGKNFVSFADGVALDSTLQQRVLRLSQCALDCGLANYVSLRQGVRSPKVAHAWSTSWNIRQGRVALAELQALKDGADLDGNVWYDKAWETGLAKDGKGNLTATGVKALWKSIKANARLYYDSDAVAAEGYPLSDPRIKPNAHRAVSNHTGGRAMDVAFGWLGGQKVFGMTIVDGENSDAAINRLVRTFSLSRPVASERWHFQLPVDASKAISGTNNTRPGRHPPPP